MQLMARSLIANNQGGSLRQMTVSQDQPFKCHTMVPVVVHAASVFLHKKGLNIILPLSKILSDPSSLNASYFLSLCKIAY